MQEIFMKSNRQEIFYFYTIEIIVFWIFKYIPNPKRKKESPRLWDDSFFIFKNPKFM